ncbi:uncharacterized protein Bfra_004653 [Botrytis fragariae]|uniref:Uncharacterized protein n=1 Tax=Botrytis fragariae TaxID=1964551 RepID=A0A8H6AW93_9HELO|nr:uncharacterized protein Bfra_004653 [Botrytis fragariae]KAF5874640.1 hypothetical protein Bfra_004653 [Botrytis fragariae]
MAARHTPVPSVGPSGSTFSSAVSTQKSLSEVYADFHKEYYQLLIRNKELSDANRKFKVNTSNHKRVHGATPFSSSGSSVTLTGSASPTSSNVPSSARDKLQEVASLLPASDEPFLNNFQASKKIWKPELKQAMDDAELIATKKNAHVMYHNELDIKTSFDKYASDMRKENGDYEIPKLDLGQKFHLADVFGHRFGFGTYY